MKAQSWPLLMVGAALLFLTVKVQCQGKFIQQAIAIIIVWHAKLKSIANKIGLRSTDSRVENLITVMFEVFWMVAS